ITLPTNRNVKTRHNDDPMRKLVSRLVRRHLRKFVRLMSDIIVKGNKKVERIHLLRSESRRADAAIRLFKDWLPSRRADLIRADLHDLREKAGAVRDFDVMVPLLESNANRLPPVAVDWLRERAASQRSKNARSLKRSCRKRLDNGIESRTEILI